MSEKTRTDIFLDLVIHLVRERWSYNLAAYSRASLSRRVELTCEQLKLDDSFSLLALLHDRKDVFDQLLVNMSVTVTDMYRDPEVFQALKTLVFPELHSYPFIKIWHPGCATGEEMYSLAILLEEAGLLKKCMLYGTDINTRSLEIAEEGIYSLDRLKTWAQLYRRAGGEKSLTEYFHAAYGLGKMDTRLKEHMSFSKHDLSGDEVFGEFHLIVCRNVLIYFRSQLQLHVLKLFRRSLVNFGFLCLGLREYLPDPHGWHAIERKLQIYRKNGEPGDDIGD